MLPSSIPSQPAENLAGERVFGLSTLLLDAELETNRICAWLRRVLARDLRRRGLVVAMSGGVDSTVAAALAVRALGRERVFGLFMPERHSDPDSLRLGQQAAEQFGIACAQQDITGTLEAVGFYKAYDAAVRQVLPEYGEGWRSKIVAADATGRTGFNFFSIVTRSPGGDLHQQRLPLAAYLEIVAATNFKQRIRKMFEYYHADRLNYAVAGTPNRLEYDQGFFVKNGDGAADVKPMAHLYKSQIYQLAEHLGIMEDIRNRPPTTDTYSLPQGQDEFFFSLPYAKMDLCLYARNNGINAEDTARACALTVDQVRRVWSDIDMKRSTTRYQQLPPLLLENVETAPN